MKEINSCETLVSGVYVNGLLKVCRVRRDFSCFVFFLGTIRMVRYPIYKKLKADYVLPTACRKISVGRGLFQDDSRSGMVFLHVPDHYY